MRLRSGKKINWNLNNSYNDLLIDIIFDMSIYDNNMVIIRNICDILCCIFNINLYDSYKIKSTFEIDYKIKWKNRKHMNKIMYIVKMFFKSDEYKNKNCIIKFMHLFGIIFYYFQMVIIETLYNDMVTWNFIKLMLNKNSMFESNCIKYGVDIYNKLTICDDDIFCHIRRYILSIS